jgi:hypothetical protein
MIAEREKVKITEFIKNVEDPRDARRFPKYTWVGNRISVADMARLYRLKQIVKIPITRLVSQAVKEYLDRQEKQGGLK